MCLVTGTVMMMVSGLGLIGVTVLPSVFLGGVNQADLLGDAGARARLHGHTQIEGAKNILLIGTDARTDQSQAELIRADSIIIAHIPKSHDSVYMTSIPRDTVVNIPENDNGVGRYPGGRTKINAAYAYGGKGLSGHRANAAAVRLLARTIAKNFGVVCDAAAIVDFDGFRKVVKILGGVDMYVDQETVSIHIGFTSDGTVKVPFKQVERADGGVRLIPVEGVSPQIYHVGHQHLTPSQALDYVRQRDTLPNSDYDRQRHQQQFIKAVVTQVMSDDLLADPVRLTRVAEAVGRAVTVDTGGIPIEDWVYAMRGIRADNVITLKSNNGTFHHSSDGVGESLDNRTLAMLKSITKGTIASFVAANPDVVSQN